MQSLEQRFQDVLKEIVKIKNDNKKLNQQINSEKLKSGELQVRLAELKNKISQALNKGGMQHEQRPTPDCG